MGNHGLGGSINGEEQHEGGGSINVVGWHEGGGSLNAVGNHGGGGFINGVGQHGGGGSINGVKLNIGTNSEYLPDGKSLFSVSDDVFTLYHAMNDRHKAKEGLTTGTIFFYRSSNLSSICKLALLQRFLLFRLGPVEPQTRMCKFSLLLFALHGST